MNYSKFGFHIHTAGLPAEADTRLHNSIAALNSTVSLVLNNSGYAHDLKARHPDTEIILRLMAENGATDDELHKKNITPANHADWYEMHLSDKRIICHGMNEPQWVDNYQLDPAAIQWSIEFGRACIKRGLRAVLWNTGAGKINDKNVHALKPLIELVNQHPGQLYLGLHEYSNFDYQKMYPWLFGSFHFIHQFCEDSGLARPQIIFTEWGYDTKHPKEQGIHWNLAEAIRYGGGAVNAAQNLINAYNQLYKNYDNIIGMCYFCYGSESSLWYPYDIIRNGYPAFLNHIVAVWPRESVVIPEPPPQPDDTQPSEPIEIPDEPEPPQAPGTLCAALRWLLRRFCEDCE